MPIDNFAGNPDRLGYDLTNGTTYHYKYKVCDPSSNCATSACVNFTTETTEQEFYFGANPPAGFEVPNPWGSGDLSLAKQINSTAGKDKNLTINCPIAGYSLTLVGIDVKSAKEIDLQGLVCDTSNDVIGMGSSTWNQLLSDLSVDLIEITWNTGGDSATIEHCTEANGTGTCKDVTTYLDCTVTSSSVTCRIPVTLGFSSYKLSTTTTTTTTTTSSGGGGGGGGIASGSPSAGIKASHYYQLITSEETNTMSINKPAIAITSNTFTVNKQLEKVTITITTVENESLLPSTLDNAYQYLEITTGNMQNIDLGQPAELEFRINKSWLTNKNANPESVVLMRYNNGWNELPTTLTTEGYDYIYYKATTPGFSYFAVIFKETLEEAPLEEPVEPIKETVLTEEKITGAEEITGAVVAEPKLKLTTETILFTVSMFVFVVILAVLCYEIYHRRHY